MALNNLLDKTIYYYYQENEFIETSSYTVPYLLDQLFSDLEFKEKVLFKLKEYTKSMNNMKEDYHKPKYFYEFIEVFRKYKPIIDFNKNYINVLKIINSPPLYFKKYICSPIPQVHCNTGISYHDKQEYSEIFLNSIVIKESIDLYGPDGFTAMLLIFIDWNYIWIRPKSLQEIIGKYYADDLNNSENRIQKIKNLDDRVLNNSYFRRYLEEYIQLTLFNEYDNGKYIIQYDTNGRTIVKIKYEIIFNARYTTFITFENKKQIYKYNDDLELIEISEYHE